MPFIHDPGQTTPQAPQLFLSTLGFTQAVPQRSPLPGHPHMAASQVWPEPHLSPQPPQFAALLVVFTQSGGVPHAVVLVGQTQAPAAQT